MALLVRQFPCLQDNYGFLLRDETSGKVACVDTPDPDAILAEIEKAGWGGLDLILNTHWHPDHAGGNERPGHRSRKIHVQVPRARRAAHRRRTCAGRE